MRFINPAKVCKGMEMGDIPPSREILKTTLAVAWPSVLESFLSTWPAWWIRSWWGPWGPMPLAAVGLTIQPKMLGLALFLSLNVAVSAIVARRKGAGDRESANRVVRMCLLITLGMTALTSALFVAFAGPIVRLVALSRTPTNMRWSICRLSWEARCSTPSAWC